MTTPSDPETFRKYIDWTLSAMLVANPVQGRHLIIDKSKLPGHATVYWSDIPETPICCVPQEMWDEYWQRLKDQAWMPPKYPWESSSLDQLFGTPVIIKTEEENA